MFGDVVGAMLDHHGDTSQTSLPVHRRVTVTKRHLQQITGILRLLLVSKQRTKSDRITLYILIQVYCLLKDHTLDVSTAIASISHNAEHYVQVCFDERIRNW